VATREDQPQAVVLNALTSGRIRFIARLRVQTVGKLGERRVCPRATTHRIDPLNRPAGNQPRARIRRHALARPLLHRRRKRVVQRLLGKVEIPEQPYQCGKHAAATRRGKPRLPFDARQPVHLTTHAISGGRNYGPARGVACYTK
jgi:hypothetical protein